MSKEQKKQPEQTQPEVKAGKVAIGDEKTQDDSFFNQLWTMATTEIESLGKSLGRKDGAVLTDTLTHIASENSDAGKEDIWAYKEWRRWFENWLSNQSVSSNESVYSSDAGGSADSGEN
jgi:hypothetical protein